MRFSLKDLTITQSLLSRWLTCPRKAELYLEGWRSTLEKRAMRLGSVVHQVIADVYASGDAEDERIVDESAERFVQQHLPQTMDPETLEQDAAIATVLSKAYFSHYRKRDASLTWESLEETFEVALRFRLQGRKGDYVRYRLAGRRDGVFLRNGKRWLLETKTKSSWNPEQIQASLNIDFQSLFYVLSLDLQNRPTRGVVYNLIRTPNLRQGKKETFNAYLDRVTADIASRPDWYFVRFEAAFTRRQRQAFRTDLSRILREFYRAGRGERPVYKNLFACRGYGWSCEYLQACSSGSMAGYAKNEDGEVHRELADADVKTSHTVEV